MKKVKIMKNCGLKSIRSITKNSDDSNEKYMKIKFNSDDELPLKKTVEIPTIAIVVRALFLKTKNIIWKFVLDECLYKI